MVPVGLTASAYHSNGNTSTSSSASPSVELPNLGEYTKGTGHVSVPNNSGSDAIIKYLNAGDCDIVVLEDDSHGMPSAADQQRLYDYTNANRVVTSACSAPQVVEGVGNLSLIQTGDHVYSGTPSSDLIAVTYRP